MTDSDELENLARAYINQNGDWDTWEIGYESHYTLKLPDGSKKRFPIDYKETYEVIQEIIQFMIKHYREWLLENDNGND